MSEGELIVSTEHTIAVSGRRDGQVFFVHNRIHDKRKGASHRKENREDHSLPIFGGRHLFAFCVPVFFGPRVMI
jgi:hypothetical protein